MELRMCVVCACWVGERNDDLFYHIFFVRLAGRIHFEFLNYKYEWVEREMSVTNKQ
jgi:hypothetical protein